MFRDRKNDVFTWTVVKRPTRDYFAQIKLPDARVIRSPALGVMLGFGIVLMGEVILSTANIRWLEVVGFIGVICFGLGIVFFLAVRFEVVSTRYAITDKWIHLIGGITLRFSSCLGCAVAPLKTHFELLSQGGHVIRFELPEDETLRVQILDYVLHRVKPWNHMESPSEMLAKAAVLKENLVLPYWATTLFGSPLLAYWIASIVMINNLPFFELLFGGLFIGNGWFWVWSAWRNLQFFPLRRRIEYMWNINLAGNALFAALFFTFFGVFFIQRIAP